MKQNVRKDPITWADKLKDASCIFPRNQPLLATADSILFTQ